ncbi:MAG: BMP family ABC transporter substrate-binding protein [Oscillospiraceae bacterium]|nr:BMP family ABC transporter substrate-binding protein [Oscillospiraceae bacterium]
MKRRRIVIAAFCVLLLACPLFYLSARRGRNAQAITKIGALMGGSVNDRSYTQAHYAALAAVSEKLGLELLLQENVRADETFPALAESLIADGCGVIVSDNLTYEPYLLKLADAYPNIYFLNACGTESAPNYSSYSGRVYQARYLSGIVAGLKTRTNEIGYVLAYLTPETIRQLNAFTIGVRKANPDAIVYARHTDDWNDGEKAASVTTALLDAHNIDALTLHTNPISPLRIADERGVYVIGNNYDNRELFPDTYLTACVFNWEPFFEARLRECAEGRFVGQHYWEGVRSGLVSLAPLTEIAGPEARNVAGAELRRLLRGEFDVFFGPVRDIYGTVQVQENENLSDRELLYGMYWFVDGVIME